MANGWNYAELSKLAKQSGGPEKLLKVIKSHAFQQGVKTGNKKMIPAAILALGTGALITVGVQKVPQFIQHCRCKFKKHEITAEEAKAAEELLIQGMKEAEEAEVEQSVPGTEADVIE